MRKNNLLFVSYGGAHVFILAPLIKKAKELGFNVNVASFTTGPDLYNNIGIDCVSAKGFLLETDLDVKKYGQMLLDEMKANGNKVIDEEETIAYLGFSFADLVKSKGSFEKAKDDYTTNGRGSLLPITMMQRIFNKFSPDFVITTNSPRAEKAAQVLAKENGIPSLQIPDLFCNFERYNLIADNICVINETAKQNLINLYNVDSKLIKITGNPDFDKFVNMAKELDTDKIKELKEKYDLNAEKYVLWNDQKTIFTGETHSQFENTEEIVKANLEEIKTKCEQSGYKLLVKCHTSQDEEMFRQWCLDNNATFIENTNLYDFMKVANIVIGYSSTILVNAYNLGKPVIMLNKTGEKSFLPITDRKAIREVTDLSQLNETIKELENIGSFDDTFGDGTAVDQIIDIISKSL
tara:strand:- start:4797 stop:6020 length:1224 start_codon:yes stop_codon:yes gene_type:complete